MSHEFEIAMLGPSGVGKTSLVSAIHTELAQGIAGTDLHVRAPRGTARYLQDRRAELERLCRSAYVTEPGIRGTATARSLELVLADLDDPEDGELTLRFTDHPGGWLFSASTPTEAAFADLQERFNRARALVLVVDTPALMWRDGFYHHDVNRPMQVQEELRDWLAGGRATGAPKRLVLVAPVKSEAWIAARDPQPGLDELADAVAERYADALDLLRRDGQVAAWLTPVHTVGGLIHDGYRRTTDGTLQSRFRGESARPRYAPRWGGEVLRHVLLSSIDLRVEQRSLWEGLARLFGVGRQIEQAAEFLAGESMGPSTQLVEPG